MMLGTRAPSSHTPALRSHSDSSCGPSGLVLVILPPAEPEWRIWQEAKVGVEIIAVFVYFGRLAQLFFMSL